MMHGSIMFIVVFIILRYFVLLVAGKSRALLLVSNDNFVQATYIRGSTAKLSVVVKLSARDKYYVK